MIDIGGLLNGPFGFFAFVIVLNTVVQLVARLGCVVRHDAWGRPYVKGRAAIRRPLSRQYARATLMSADQALVLDFHRQFHANERTVMNIGEVLSVRRRFIPWRWVYVIESASGPRIDFMAARSAPIIEVLATLGLRPD